jgi:hypothetical protein
VANLPWTKWSPLSGLVSVVFWVVVLILVGDGAGDLDREILAYYGDDSNRNQEIATFFLILAASLFFLWFLAELRQRLLAAEGGPSHMTALAFSSGLLTTVLLLTANVFFVATAFATGDDHFRLDPNTHRLISNIGYGLFVSALTISFVLILVTSILAVRAGALPRWLGWLGFPIAVFMLVSIIFLPFFGFLGWVGLTSIALTWLPAGARVEPANVPPE